MCSTTLWARNVSSRWLGCARGTALSTAFALPANWTRMAPPLRPPRRLRRVTSAPTTLATSSRTSAGSSSGWVPWFIGSKGRSPSRMAGPADSVDESHDHLDPGGDDVFAVGVDRRLTEQQFRRRECDKGTEGECRADLGAARAG